MIVDFNCGIDREGNGYIPFEEYRKESVDSLQVVQNFYNCLKFVASTECTECKNRCELYKKVRADLDGLYKNDTERFYEYMTEVLSAFDTAIELNKPEIRL